jgi:hypothetical protein
MILVWLDFGKRLVWLDLDMIQVSEDFECWMTVVWGVFHSFEELVAVYSHLRESVALDNLVLEAVGTLESLCFLDKLENCYSLEGLDSDIEVRTFYTDFVEREAYHSLEWTVGFLMAAL